MSSNPTPALDTILSQALPFAVEVLGTFLPAIRTLMLKAPRTSLWRGLSWQRDAGWTLIAREGRPLGFVATKDLAPIEMRARREGMLATIMRLSVIKFAVIGISALAHAQVQSSGPPAAASKEMLPIEIVPNVPTYAASFAFSSDGSVAASGGGDGTVKLWDVATGRLLRTFRGHSGDVQSVAFSADGTRILSASKEKSVKLWDAATGRLLRSAELRSHSKEITKIALSPDGTRVLSGSWDNTMKLWDADTGRLLRTFTGFSSAVVSVAFSPDGTRVLSGAETAKLWDTATGRLLRTFTGHASFNTVWSVAFSPDGTRILSGSSDKTVKSWDVATGRLLRTFVGHADTVWAVAVSPNGTHVLSGSADKTMKVWDTASARLLHTLVGHRWQVRSVAFSPDGSRLLSGSDAGDSTVRLWDVASGQLVRNLGADVRYTSSGAFSAAGHIVSGGDKITLWSADTGGFLRSFEGHSDLINSVTFSPDGTRVLSGSNDKTVKLWDAATGQLLRTFAGHVGEVESVAFSPDGNRVLSGGGSDDYTVNLWDVATGRLLRSFKERAIAGQIRLQSSVYSVAFSPDGARVLSVGFDKTAKLWDATTGQLLRTLVHSEAVVRVAFSPDGSRVLTGSFENTMKLWDVTTGQLLRTFTGHSGAVSTVAFSPDGARLLSGSHDHTAKLWDTASGRVLHTFEDAYGLQFSRDGTRVLLRQNHTLKVSNANTGELLVSVIASQDNEWLAITPEGFFVASEKGAGILSVVRGFDVWSIDQFYQTIYRPDLVREKLAGDTRGLVREAAAKLDLTKVLASGNAPVVSMLSPRDGTRATGEQINAEVEIAERGGGIGRIEWRVNGVTVGIETPPAPPAGQPLRLTRDLVLDDGENEIEVVAYNGANLVASVPARATVAGQAQVSRTAARMFVLAVGLNDYAEAKFKLTYAVPDAKALAQAFTDAGKGVYESVEVTLVQDADVKRGKLDAVFTELATKVRPSDVFVFFLGGHGKTVDGRYYFIPQDFHIDGTVTKVALESAVVQQGIAQEQWQAWLARIPAKKSVLLFDTCESGSLTGEGKETRALERGAANDRLVQATGRTILTASSDDTDAFEGFRGHGLFTYNVLEALERADSDGNGRIEVAELAAYVYAQVTALSEQVFKQRQVPQVRITGNYSLTKPTQMFAGKEPGIVLPGKATHQVTSAAELLVLPAMGARRVRKLDAKTPVTLVKSDAGWTLIAREGRPLGFVATKDLAPIQ